MTENKRFVYMDLVETEAISVSDDECYYFNEYGSVEKICSIMNGLAEENEQLKNELTELKSHIVEEKVYYPSSDECFICECGRELIQKESFKKNKPLFVCNDCGKSYFREEIKTENILWKDCCGEIHKERPYITERKWKE